MDEHRRVSLPHAISGIDVDNPNNKTTNTNAGTATQPIPAVPPSAIRMAKIGGTIALIAAAAISAQSLISLGHILGLHGKVAWLLPVSLDVYAATSIWVGYRIPAIHPAARIARRDARLALSLTVCCNALFHLLLLAGSQLPQKLTDGLLVLVGALPPLVVERIFHLQMAVRDGDGNAAATEAAAADGGGKRQPPREGSGKPAAATAAPAPATAAPATAAARPGNATPAGGKHAAKPNGNSTGKTAAPTPAGDGGKWAELALPLWKDYVDRRGETPTAPILAALLRNAHPHLKIPGSPRSERNIRSAVERLLLAEQPADDRPAVDR